MQLKLLLSLFLMAPAVSAREFNVYLLLQSMISGNDSTYRSAFTDPQVCYDRLISADNDSSYQVTRQEYVKFARLSGPPGFLRDIVQFQDMPLTLQATFNALSCLCPGSSKTNCCNDMLNINGVGGDATESEKNELFLICSLTRLAIDYVSEASAGPTSAPTLTTPPTVSPTKLGSSPPTLVPTVSPSTSPTMPPTKKPSPAPTSTPSNLPTFMPSASPTRAASGLPTTEPTVAPTPSPTLAASGLPTTEPSVAPSPSPSLPPEPTVSAAPTGTPSAAPTAPLLLEYRVGVTNGTYTPELYEAQLVGAMDSLAPEILVATLGERRRRLLRQQRRLQSVALPTKIEEYLQDECDAFLPSEDGCAIIRASVVLQLPPGSSDADVAEEFKSQLQEAIDSGELSDKLETQNPETPLYVIDEPLLDAQSTSRGGIFIQEDDEGGPGAGIAIAGIVLFSACLLFYIWHDRKKEDKDDKDELEPLDAAPRDLPFLDKDGREIEIDKEPTTPEKIVPVTTPERKKKHKPSKSKSVSPNRPDHDSDAGDSGWSSSAGVSSSNTGDKMRDDEDYEAAQVGSQMESSLDTSADDVSVPTTSSVTRADLDNAIEAGDWAAVGATAALLAAASDSNSQSSRSFTNPGTSTRDGTSTVSSFEAAHVAELDHLVDAGDWEGVVLAAARFEASTVASDSESRSLASSKKGKQQGFRAQVEELVLRVAPEEAENIDEMILQFHGREDELIETLKIMEERKLAQEGKGVTPPAADMKIAPKVGAASRSLGTGSLTPQRKGGSVTTSLGPQVEGSAKSLGTGILQKSQTPREQKQSRLEQAIEAGDWEAVGEAAAMLNDAASTSSADTDEINRLADGFSADTGDYSTESGKKRASKADELDKLIDQGDWMGVVQAAADLETDDNKKKARTKSWFSRERQEKDKYRDERLNKLKAEQEALEKADLWMTIAEKSKDDTKKDDRGASEAADWAIGRSLAALVNAEGTPGKSPKKSASADTQEYEV